MRVKIYHFLVNRVPEIQRRYHRLRQQKKGTFGRIYAWIALLWMNFISIFCHARFDEAFYYPDKKKKLPKDVSESSLSFRETPEELANRLMQHDVISFDVFDTLILRPFSAPTDLFFMVGDKLGYPDFERIRRKMEEAARRKAKAQTGSYEVTLAQIYDELERQAGIPKDRGMQAEIETELQYCFANPYMLEVFRYLKDCGRKIICTSDMYLPETVIRQMVEKCGYEGICDYFISNERGAAKGDGSLFQKVKETCGKEKSYIHVGDNYASDVEWAAKSGFETVFYQNVNVAGVSYRAEDMSAITGSIYRGIVNAHIHNGLKNYSKEYELGYIYGGLFVLGYCQWIHEYVQRHGVNKLLFLSRDGDIINQAYSVLYPDQSGEGKTEYVYWSRLAATKMAAGYYKYDYFRRFIEHKMNQNYTLANVFESMEIGDMLESACQAIGLTKDAVLTEYNADAVKNYLQEHWEAVLEHYEEQLAAGKLYYEQVLQGCKRVAAVDVGWAGSGAMALNYIVNDIWNIDCEVVGLLAGTNTIHDVTANMSEAQLYSGKLASYIYSQEHNRDIWRWHDAAKGHNVGIELMCSSANGSLKGFYLESTEGVQSYRVALKEPDVNVEVSKDIQKGVLDFVRQAKSFDLAEHPISGNDAYQVLRIFLDNGKSTMQLMEQFDMGI